MATIIKGPKKKRVTCDVCEATIEYLPEEVEKHNYTDYGGGPAGYERVKCPRTKCSGHGYIKVW